MPRLGLAVLCAVTLAGPATAQVPSGPAPNAAVSTRRNPATVERHIADLHRRLAITPAQEPQWAGFAEIMRDNSRRLQASEADRAARTASSAPPMNAVDDMRNYAALARTHADDLQRLVPAFETLYAAMTPEQKALADRTFQQFQARSGRRPGAPG